MIDFDRAPVGSGSFADVWHGTYAFAGANHYSVPTLFCANTSQVAIMLDTCTDVCAYNLHRHVYRHVYRYLYRHYIDICMDICIGICIHMRMVHALTSVVRHGFAFFCRF